MANMSHKVEAIRNVASDCFSKLVALMPIFSRQYSNTNASITTSSTATTFSASTEQRLLEQATRGTTLSELPSASAQPDANASAIALSSAEQEIQELYNNGKQFVERLLDGSRLEPYTLPFVFQSGLKLR